MLSNYWIIEFKRIHQQMEPSGTINIKAAKTLCKPVKLKGHGNEADILGFLQNLVHHRSLTLPFATFQFWLRIRGDICNRRLGESATLWLGDSGSRWVDYEYLRKFEAKIGTTRHVEKGTYAEPIYAETPENPPSCHVPLNIFLHSRARNILRKFFQNTVLK
jgi:hypothetical protein